LETTCDSLVDDLDAIIDGLNNQVSVSQICIDLEYCSQPFENHPDKIVLPKWTLDMGLPASKRWSEICSFPIYQELIQYLINTIDSLLPGQGKILEDIGFDINRIISRDVGDEIMGCANSLGVSTGWLTLLNLGYEVSDACTSIVAESVDGSIYHARNLDFWDGIFLTDVLRNVSVELEIVNGTQKLFRTASIVGYVGVLSGHKPNAFSATINTRFYPEGLYELFYEIIAAIEERNASLTSVLLRNVLLSENDFDAAIENLSNGELVTDVYYTVAGVSSGQGAVISRNRFNASDIWRLNATGGEWFLVETNYDHWEEPPWFDDRVHPAYKAMNSMGRSTMTLSGLLDVLSVKPILNLQSTYSILSIPANATWLNYQRYCNYPCAE